MIVRRHFAISLCLSATLSMGLTLAATDSVSAATVSRDHRGAKVVPQPPPKLGGPKWKGGYDTLGASGKKGTTSGVTVRDHR